MAADVRTGADRREDVHDERARQLVVWIETRPIVEGHAVEWKMALIERRSDRRDSALVVGSFFALRPISFVKSSAVLLSLSVNNSATISRIVGDSIEAISVAAAGDAPERAMPATRTLRARNSC